MTTPREDSVSSPDIEDEPPEAESEPDPHAELLARLRERNAASEINYRIKSGELP
ncbi:hypothetical protein [Streptomyces profundus]|uniref:hypothetical protein n=1 Tax=Streptomyces profundus TaxID=2867410 RepID=UPI001D160085|nr:hypothetical protein [Streptomyces sp. MA3_2.13]UED83870.1 hypothetical protein K4G22_06295 [Streptomyces sp. MA3_2.13]